MFIIIYMSVVQTVPYTELCVCCLFVCLLCFSAKDPTGWMLFDCCLELLKSRMESRELNKEVSDKCAQFDIWV